MLLKEWFMKTLKENFVVVAQPFLYWAIYIHTYIYTICGIIHASRRCLYVITQRNQRRSSTIHFCKFVWHSIFELNKTNKKKRKDTRGKVNFKPKETLIRRRENKLRLHYLCIDIQVDIWWKLKFNSNILNNFIYPPLIFQ